jgi:DNA-binding response OmpR family regulator
MYKKDSEGSGIGLALTKELVELCRGDISVSSIPDKMTTFNVTLPIDKENFNADEITTQDPDILVPERSQAPGYDQEQVTSNEERKTKNEQRKSSILIVEDNPDIIQYIASFLDHEYLILTAENGKTGLKKIIDKNPDLVISDIMMPEMDGFELCKMIKNDERISHIPVILLTAKADVESKVEGLEFGADDYISKPFEARELQARAANLIGQRKKLREKFARMTDFLPGELAVTPLDEKFLQRLMIVFENHISEPDFSTEECAREVGMSRMSLNTKLKALTNQSTHEFIRSLRLKRAAQLLKKAAGSVAEIAYTVGFNNTSHFAKAFREQFGLPPSKFAQKNNKNIS